MTPNVIAMMKELEIANKKREQSAKEELEKKESSETHPPVVNSDSKRKLSIFPHLHDNDSQFVKKFLKERLSLLQGSFLEMYDGEDIRSDYYLNLTKSMLPQVAYNKANEWVNELKTRKIMCDLHVVDNKLVILVVTPKYERD